jgi:beta-glucosidase
MNKTAKRKKGGIIAWGTVSTFLIVLLLVATILVNTTFHSIVSTALGGQTPIIDDSGTKYYNYVNDDKSASKKAGDDLNVEIAEEGFTLLLNEDNALPISTPTSKTNPSTTKPKVSVFGKNSVDLVLSGSGSGAISTDSATTLFDSLEDNGFEVNPKLKAFYEDDSKSGSGRPSTLLTDSTTSSPTLATGETPVKSYTSEVKSSFTDYNDVAIVVISRLGGESYDLPRSQDLTNGGIKGNHYLQLDQNEYDMLDMVTSRFSKVVVLLNTLTSFQCDFIEEYNNTATNKRIDAVLWIGGPGTTGAQAVGEILNGNVNPSGRTTDLYSANFKADPTWQNFGDGSQTTTNDVDNSAFVGTAQYMVSYEEGIYIGYRYYETRDYEEYKAGTSSTWYSDNVIFPFGYGLSYTQFKQSMKVTGSLEDKNSKLTIEVTSENVGSVAGKDVIELYVTKPYTVGGIEKAYVELVDYAKTDTIEAGKTYTTTFTVDAYDLASYDYNDANGNSFYGYELDSGDYTFYVSPNSHVGVDGSNAYASATVTLSSNVRFETDPVTGNTVANLYSNTDPDQQVEEFLTSDYRLDDVLVSDENGQASTRKGMSRSDFAGTFPVAPTEADRAVKTDSNNKTEIEYLNSTESGNTEVAKEAEKYTSASYASKKSTSTLTLKNMLDETGHVTYEDAKWEELLDKITFDDMLSLVNNGAFQTNAIEYIDKNLTNDSDGPAGFVNFINTRDYKNNTTFASEIVLGSTWNKDLAYRMGKAVGENGLYGASDTNGLPYSGWYAPAVNLHRSPFSGRNYEYYSEDPILSGKMAVNVINGAAQFGVYTDLKHFALNDQETNRSGIATYCTEQAMRELYLKAFEIAVKGDDDPSQVKTAKADNVTTYQGTMGIMSSFNRIGTRWTGGDYRLLTTILRNEWGFKGLVISDYKTSNAYMDSKQMLYAGNDLILTSTQFYMWNDASSTSVEDMVVLRKAVKNILYTVANSNSVNVTITGYNMEWWMATLIAVDVIVPVGLAVWGFFVIRSFIKKGKETA